MKAINIMENTLENKAKFFALYWWQEICRGNQGRKHTSVDGLSLSSINIHKNWIELKSLSSITEEDAIEVSKYMNLGHLNPPENRIKLVRDILMKVDPKGNVYLWVNIIDYLRSHGYALPYMGLSVEKQIEYGWIKLTSNESN